MAGPRFPALRLLPLCAFLLLSLAGCIDRDLPTGVMPGRPAFSQVSSGPIVNSLLDDGTGMCTDTKCTLRDAISYAAQGATISFSVTGTIQLTGGTLSIEQPLTITGPGASLLTVDANSNSQVFYVTGTTVTISGLTIRGGFTESGTGGGVDSYQSNLTLDQVVIRENFAGYGGGIYANEGSLAVTRSTITDNIAASGGGGIGGQYAVLTLTECEVSSNTGGAWGGGIYNDRGALALVRSLVSVNHAGEGGGVYTESGTDPASGAGLVSAIVNSTVAGNSATFDGGGIYQYGGLANIVYTTILDNSATDGGGVISYSAADAPTNIKGSIIWNNTGNAGADDVAGMADGGGFNSLGYNIVGAAGYDVVLALEFNQAGDQVGVDPLLLSRALNQPGTTETYAVQPESPARDVTTGPCTDHNGDPLLTDQRGVSRPQGSGCDAGAYELVPPEPTFSSSCTFLINVKNGQRNVTVTWENASPGVTRIEVKDGRTVTRFQAPRATGSWSTTVKSGEPSYGLWGGASRKDSGTVLTPAGTACTG
jgi:CSLREA domain-containing protein